MLKDERKLNKISIIVIVTIVILVIFLFFVLPMASKAYNNDKTTYDINNIIYDYEYDRLKVFYTQDNKEKFILKPMSAIIITDERESYIKEDEKTLPMLYLTRRDYAYIMSKFNLNSPVH